MNKTREKLDWRVDTPQLLKEILEANDSLWIMNAPINILRTILIELAQRCIEVNDPQLNILMLRLKLYEVDHKDIQPMIEQIEKQIKQDEL